MVPPPATTRRPAPSESGSSDRTAPGSPARWEEFDVPYETGANVISCLQWIAANPRTTDGRESTPVVYDSGCLEEVCGACTMVINGGVRQSCTALIENIVDESNSITLEPMSSLR